MAWDALETIGTLAAALGGTGIGLWVKSVATEVAKREFGELIVGFLSANNDRLLDRINGTYIRSAGTDLTGAEIKRRLEKLEDPSTGNYRRMEASAR